MADSTSDFYHSKTDDELRFFVKHPDYYHPDLVALARRELRRRGLVQDLPLAPAPAPVLAAFPALDLASEPAPTSSAPLPATSGLKAGPLMLGIIVALCLSVGLLYFIKQKNSPPVRHSQLPAATRTASSNPALQPQQNAEPKAMPHLAVVATSVIPEFGPAVEQAIEQQLERVPATERAKALEARMPMDQYRGLARRFWTAETQTEYLLNQARQDTLSTATLGHVEAVQAAWEQWNTARLYSYEFGPVMNKHLDLMTRVARQQQDALSDLLRNSHTSADNDRAHQHAADMGVLLTSLLSKSPVTGQPYSNSLRPAK